jgi:cellulose synthase (UDP-forming)
MILAPLSFLILGIYPLRADVAAVIAYILPHIGLSTIANSIISKSYRDSFYAGAYEVAIAPYTAAVTLLALINPKLGKFNVTEKGTNLEKARFDYQTGWPTLALLGISVVALAIAFPLRLWLYSAYGTNPEQLDAILINSIWAFANFITLIAAACVAYDRPQRRVSPRLGRYYVTRIVAGDEVIRCISQDLSEAGIRVLIDTDVDVPAEAEILIGSDFGPEVRVKAELVRKQSRNSRVEAAFAFTDVDAATYRDIVQLMFSGDHSWTGQNYASDSAFRSLWSLVTTFWRVSGAEYE